MLPIILIVAAVWVWVVAMNASERRCLAEVQQLRGHLAAACERISQLENAPAAAPSPLPSSMMEALRIVRLAELEEASLRDYRSFMSQPLNLSDQNPMENPR